MRELNRFSKTTLGTVYTKFAEVQKIAPKLNISLCKMTIKRNSFIFGIGLTLIFAAFLLVNFRDAETYTKPAYEFNAPIKSDISLKKVVIDAGHGGKDPGTLGVNGIKEKNIVLDIAQMLGEKINAQYPEIEVTFTRDTDIFIPLHERAKIANQKGADLFISIHANSAAAEGAYGTECFVLGLHKTKENLDVAKRENSTILMEDNYEMRYEGFDPNSDESYIALSLQQGIHLDQSLNIAVKVQDEFVKAGRRDRGVRQAGFLVLHQTAMPSILVEVGFVSNPKEGPDLNQKPLRTKLADALFSAFNRYRNEIEEKNEQLNSTVEETPKKEAEMVVEAQNNVEVKSTETPNGIVFKVQIASLPNEVKIAPENFNGLTDITEFKINGVYKYLVGNENSFESAVKLQREIREKAYKDAFIVAFNNGEKISITEAFKILETNP
jgi:N-acetylmuramoyl-L-alanine amidase